jgi:DNA polymerase-3 subunit beta
MKFTIDRAPFLKALSHGQSVVEKHTSVPILTHVLIQAKEGMVRLSTTDLEMSLVEEVSADISEEGAVALPAHMLHDLVRKLPDGARVEISWEEGAAQAELASNSADFHLSCLPAQDFPEISQDSLPHQFKIPAKVLHDILDRCRFAMSTEETRYYLNGIYLHVVDGKELRTVATDGHRLARVAVGMPEGAQSIPGCILPRKTVSELLKLIVDQTEDVAVSLSDTQVSFGSQHARLSSRLIDGTFPDYETVIPSGNDQVMRVPLKSFSGAIDRVATMAPEKERGIKLNIKDGKLKLSAVSAERGSGEEEVEVDYQGIPLEIGFNAKYLIDIAQQMGSEDAEFSMKDSGTAAVVRDLQDASSLYVLMPMRV